MNSDSLALAPATAHPPVGSVASPAPRAGVLDDPHEQAAFTRWFAAPDGSRRAVSQFQLSGLHCAACAGIIEGALLEVPGVREARVAAATSLAQVEWDPRRTRASVLVAAIERAGYGAVPDLAAPARVLREREWRQALWRLFVAGICMMQVMMVAAPAYFAAPGEISTDLLRLLNWAAWLLSLPVLLFSATPFFRSAWRALRSRRIAMDLPVTVGIAVTFIASSGATFAPGGVFGAEVYFDSLTMFVFFLLGGRTLELRTRHRAAAALEQTMNRLPESVLRLGAEGAFESVSVRALVVGDRVRVLSGQAFPADGELLEGNTQADEALLTGESRPRPKARGDALVAGSLNLHAPVLMRVDRLGADTRYEGIVALMRSALLQRPAAVRLADRLAGPFLRGVLLLAAAAALVWSFIDPARAVWVAVSVLIVTCPCALSLAAPSALLAATGALARRGVLLQRLEALEILAKVDTLFVDKTGTLTEDRLALRGVHLLTLTRAQEIRGEGGTEPPASQQTLLADAASLAAFSLHPLSLALAAAGKALAGDPASWSEVSEVAGCGLQARAADGRWYRLGSREWVNERHDGTAGRPAADIADADMPADTQAGDRSDGSDGSDRNNRGDGGVAGNGSATCVWYGPSGQPWLSCEFEEKLRADVAAALNRLRAGGLRVVLLSGDRPGAVQAMAARLGLDEAVSAASPETKLTFVARAQAQGRVVAMAGDGLNDAPVLARADVSFAFAHGTALTQSHADAVVLGNRLGDVAFAFELARRGVRVVRQNLLWAVAYNAACIPLALIGWLPPWAAGLGMALSSLVVVLNSVRLARQ